MRTVEQKTALAVFAGETDKTKIASLVASIEEMVAQTARLVVSAERMEFERSDLLEAEEDDDDLECRIQDLESQELELEEKARSVVLLEESQEFRRLLSCAYPHRLYGLFDTKAAVAAIKEHLADLADEEEESARPAALLEESQAFNRLLVYACTQGLFGRAVATTKAMILNDVNLAWASAERAVAAAPDLNRRRRMLVWNQSVEVSGQVEEIVDSRLPDVVVTGEESGLFCDLSEHRAWESDGYYKDCDSSFKAVGTGGGDPVEFISKVTHIATDDRTSDVLISYAVLLQSEFNLDNLKQAIIEAAKEKQALLLITLSGRLEQDWLKTYWGKIRSTLQNIVAGRMPDGVLRFTLDGSYIDEASVAARGESATVEVLSVLYKTEGVLIAQDTINFMIDDSSLVVAQWRSKMVQRKAMRANAEWKQVVALAAVPPASFFPLIKTAIEIEDAELKDEEKRLMATQAEQVKRKALWAGETDKTKIASLVASIEEMVAQTARLVVSAERSDSLEVNDDDLECRIQDLDSQELGLELEEKARSAVLSEESQEFRRLLSCAYPHRLYGLFEYESGGSSSASTTATTKSISLSLICPRALTARAQLAGRSVKEEIKYQIGVLEIQRKDLEAALDADDLDADGAARLEADLARLQVKLAELRALQRAAARAVIIAEKQRLLDAAAPAAGPAASR